MLIRIASYALQRHIWWRTQSRLGQKIIFVVCKNGLTRPFMVLIVCGGTWDIIPPKCDKMTQPVRTGGMVECCLMCNNAAHFDL